MQPMKTLSIKIGEALIKADIERKEQSVKAENGQQNDYEFFDGVAVGLHRALDIVAGHKPHCLTVQCKHGNKGRCVECTENAY